jgi:hypothetical protein
MNGSKKGPMTFRLLATRGLVTDPIDTPMDRVNTCTNTRTNNRMSS